MTTLEELRTHGRIAGGRSGDDSWVSEMSCLWSTLPPYFHTVADFRLCQISVGCSAIPGPSKICNMMVQNLKKDPEWPLIYILLGVRVQDVRQEKKHLCRAGIQLPRPAAPKHINRE